MAQPDGTLKYDTLIDSNGFKSGLAKISNLAKTALQGAATLLASATAALSAGAMAGVKYNAQMEQYITSFGTMLGSAEKAQNMISQIKKFAAETPFELPDLAKGAQTLLAFGTAEEKVLPIMKMLGDVSQGNKEKFDGLTLAFAQCQSTGKLMGQDLLQMINQGFNPLNEISKMTGKSVAQLKEEMSKGAISAEMVAAAFEHATSEGGQFYNAMEAQSKTFSGQLSTLKDNALSLLGEITESFTGSLKDTALPLVNGWMTDLADAFHQGGHEGLVVAAGDVMSDALVTAAENGPGTVQAAAGLQISGCRQRSQYADGSRNEYHPLRRGQQPGGASRTGHHAERGGSWDMTLYVYNPARERVGLVEDVRSLQWLSEYQDAGEIKLVCSATEKNRALLVDGNRLYCTEQPESAIIRQTQIDDDGKDAKLTVRAMLSAARWADRVVMATEQVHNAEAGMLSLTTKHRRGLPGITGAAKGIAVSLDTQISWGSVLDAEITLATASGLGFREVFAPDTGTETFEVYEGVDRTQGAGYNGYFGDDIDNISSLKIVRGSDGWKNYAIIGGQGEGVNRKIVTASLGAYTGDEIRELWVDAKDIGTTYQIAAPDGSGGYTYTEATYTDEEYAAALQARGLEKLAENLQTLEVDASIGQGLMEYGRDYALGDIVPLKLTRYGLRLSARISAVRTIYESTGKKVTAVLSDFNLTKEALSR